MAKKNPATPATGAPAGAPGTGTPAPAPAGTPAPAPQNITVTPAGNPAPGTPLAQFTVFAPPVPPPPPPPAPATPHYFLPVWCCRENGHSPNVLAIALAICLGVLILVVTALLWSNDGRQDRQIEHQGDRIGQQTADIGYLNGVNDANANAAKKSGGGRTIVVKPDTNEYVTHKQLNEYQRSSTTTVVNKSTTTKECPKCPKKKKGAATNAYKTPKYF